MGVSAVECRCAAFLAAVAIAAGLTTGCAAAVGSSAPQSFSSRPYLEIRNSGPAVQVVPWKGAKAILVTCGGDRSVTTASAPAPPWHLTVRTVRAHRFLGRKTIRARTGYIVVAIDHHGVHVTRGSVPASGPPPGCDRGH